MKKKSSIKDIYKGSVLNVWEDAECVFVSFPYCTVYIPKETWNCTKKDFREIGKTKENQRSN